MKAAAVQEAATTASGNRTFLATAQTRRICDEVLDTIAAFAATATGRSRVKSLAPRPTLAAATQHTNSVMQQKALAAQVDRKHVHQLLKRIRLPQDPAPRPEPGRVLVGAESVQDRLRREGAHRWIALAGMAELAQAPEYDLVLILDEAESPGIDNAIELPVDATLEDVAPESVLAWFATNRNAIEAAAGLATAIGRPSRAAETLAVLDDVLPTGPIADLKKEAVEVQLLLRTALRDRAASLSVSGAEVLDSIGRKLPAGLQKAIDDTLRQGRELMRERTGIAVQPFVAEGPLDIDEEEIERVTQSIRSRSSQQVFHARQLAARRLSPLRATVAAELEAWLAFDGEFALGSFALHYDLHPARFGAGLCFESSVHLSLADQAGAQRIAYRLGGEDERVALLTGANSGGKTTLIEHLAQLVVMARLGLPVVGAGVEVPWLDEVHVVTARRHLDAGAFESFLRGFLPVVLGNQRRLVLADEVEAVTELEAAGRILGFFLDRLAASQSLAVVVTHLAPQILARTAAPVRVDGIEATGLDAKNRLIVDRTPRMGRLARSTPELIVQRLAATAKGPQAALYADLLACFAAAPVRPRPPARPAKAAFAAGKGKRTASVSPPS